MAIIQYKCNTCKREIEVPENPRGLEVISRCIITEGCRGKLYRIDRKQDFIRGSFPAAVPGLTNYSARRILYNHEQAVSSNEWYITHNLGVAPSVQVLVERSSSTVESSTDVPCSLRNETESFDQVETTDFTVEIVNANELIVRFTDPQSGLAQLIARSSAPVITEEAVEDAIPTFQLTNNSLLVIATLNDTISSLSTINLDLTFKAPGSTTTVTESYTVSPTQDSESPWTDYTTVLIQGRRYRARSFDTYTSSMIDGTIPNGSSFYFSQVNSRDIDSQEIFILLSLDPYADIDKVTNQVIDSSRINGDNAASSLFHQDRELFAFTSVIASTFPAIRNV